jgi:predicted ATPase
MSERVNCDFPSGWYVLTGGPSAGITTLLNELSRRGYRTLPEAARTYLEAERKNGKSIEAIRADEVAFQYRILSLKRFTERQLSRNELVFFDRGIHDTIAFLRAANINIDRETAIQIVRIATYDRVFVLDMMPFVLDGIRTESEERAKLIQSLLPEAYESFGMTTVRVPILPVRERADFILQNIKHY